MITVWGVCEPNGSSWIHKDKPVLQDFKGMLTWISEPCFRITGINLFPRNEPQEFELKPIL